MGFFFYINVYKYTYYHEGIMTTIRKRIISGAVVIDKDINAPYYVEKTETTQSPPNQDCIPIQWSTPTVLSQLSNDFFSLFITYQNGNMFPSLNDAIDESVVWTWRFEYSDGRVFESGATTSNGIITTNAPLFFGNIFVSFTAVVDGCFYETTMNLGGV